ncbi:MAG: DUF4349 domain-containing protein [Chitinophagales bacterium]|nr:DUF4349 domain-containing protein [Chitinophagales bacterium]
MEKIRLTQLVVIITAITIIIGFTACKSKSEEAKEVSVDMSIAEAEMVEEVVSDAVEETTVLKNKSSTMDAKDVSTEGASKNQHQQKITRKLIKEGHLTFETNSIEKTNQFIQEQTKKLNGYVARDNQTKDEYSITNYIEVRLPTNQFDVFLNSVEKNYKRFDEKNIQVQDVTEEYIDVQTRIKTKKELENRYLEILKKANKVSDLLEVEQELNIVRNDIESAEGRLKYLNDRIEYSTFYIRFYETTAAPIGFFGELGKSFVEGWKGILYFILGVVRLWAFILIIILVAYLFIRRRRRNNKI